MSRKIKNYVLIDKKSLYDRELSHIEVSASTKRKARRIAYLWTGDDRWLKSEVTKK